MVRITFTIGIIFQFLTIHEGWSQTCVTGTLAVPASAYLKTRGPEKSITQLHAASIESLRSTPAVRPLPADSVKRLTTPDKVKINVYRHAPGNLPVIINFHSGGFVTPLTPGMEREAWRLARKLNAVVFDVDYRVAPEFKHPAAVNDAYQALLWVQEHAHEFGGIKDQIFLVGQDAGATLAALTVTKAKQAGKHESIKGIVMICPFVDNPMVSYYGSMEDNATGYGLTKDLVQFYFQTYLDKPLWFTGHAEIWPIYNKDFNGWPPVLIVTTEFDVLRDEGIAFGKKLEQGGNRVSIKCYPHQLHNFAGLSASSEEVSRVHELIQELMSQASPKK